MCDGFAGDPVAVGLCLEQIGLAVCEPIQIEVCDAACVGRTFVYPYFRTVVEQLFCVDFHARDALIADMVDEPELDRATADPELIAARSGVVLAVAVVSVDQARRTQHVAARAQLRRVEEELASGVCLEAGDELQGVVGLAFMECDVLVGIGKTLGAFDDGDVQRAGLDDLGARGGDRLSGDLLQVGACLEDVLPAGVEAIQIEVSHPVGVRGACQVEHLLTAGEDLPGFNTDAGQG